MFAEQEIEAVRHEAAYSAEKWGSEFDELNTLNDWVTYITMYASQAARMENKDNRELIYAKLIKAANLALTAACHVREINVSPRHYDSWPPTSVS